MCLQANMNVITPSHPTPPHPTQPKPDPSSVRVFASETERYCPTPPHPTQPKPDPSSVRVFASETERYCPLPHPTPPHPPLQQLCNIKWCVFMVVVGSLMKTRVCVCDPTFACVCKRTRGPIEREDQGTRGPGTAEPLILFSRNPRFLLSSLLRILCVIPVTGDAAASCEQHPARGKQGRAALWTWRLQSV